MKKVFWLLDVNAEAKERKPQIWIWGIDDKGQRVLIIQQDFPAYFYLVIEDEHDPSEVIEALTACRNSTKRRTIVMKRWM